MIMDTESIVIDVDFDKIIEQRSENVFKSMEPRVDAADMARLRDAFEMAREAHADQKRKTGEPYILHPIAVAGIAAKELMLDVNTVIAAFLHDVVEDTPHTLDEIRVRFGDDVAFLVKTVTKPNKKTYDESKQVDNYRQMLGSVQYDIRALLLKLADRLHNMRTLSSMRPDKQMKIAGETDYFYAPLANRLCLYNVKTELENLSLRFRCPHEYAELVRLIENDKDRERPKLEAFTSEIEEILAKRGIEAKVTINYRRPYSLWRKMTKHGDDYNHLSNKHYVDIVFKDRKDISDKDMALQIYSAITDRFKEKPGGISNYIDSPKENGYQSFHLKLLADSGMWEEVHIASERMMKESLLGCVVEGKNSEANVRRWIDKFRKILKEISEQGEDGSHFMENVVTSFYNDDIMTFTPQGKAVVLPQRATVLDFAYETNPQQANRAKYAMINGRLASVKTPLRRGDVVQVFDSMNCRPQPDWLEHCVSYNARKNIRAYLNSLPEPEFTRCSCCSPIPGEEVIGFREKWGGLTIHKRNCKKAISLASQFGDRIESVDFKESLELYPITIVVRAVDRYHLFVDLVDCISNTLNLSIDNINTQLQDSIVTCRISFRVHSFSELQRIIRHVSRIPGVDEVKEERHLAC